jgi:dihydroxy-acid dehydratase
VLHVTPEAAVGGPLAARTLAARKKAWKAPPPHPGSGRGYTGLFFKTVLQADEGVDFDFLGPEK